MKILALTSIRSDYDLLSPLYDLLNKDKDIDFQLLVSGAHLSKEFGYTKKQIVEDGFNILIEIETLINSDTAKSRLKTASLLLQNSIDIIDSFKPDLLLYAGDREDVIIGSLISIYLSIPSIHFYGGDHESDGHQDTYIRHATSKLSSLHFVSNKEHLNRLVSLGESKERIFDIGSISLDRLYNYSEVNITNALDTKIPNNFALMIFHPIAGEDSKKIFESILKILEERNIFTIVSYPNSDPGYEEVNQIISKNINNKNFYFYKNLSRDIFLTIFHNCSFIIGNSSAGIYEAATVKKFAINVGLRQKNRLFNDNIIYCDSKKIEINKSIDKVLSKDSSLILEKITNPYGNGDSSKKAYHLIKTLNLDNFIIKDEDPLLNNIK